MRKILLSLVCLVSLSVWSKAQIIEDFEGLLIRTTMANGHIDTPEAYEVVDNPHSDGVNGSAKVMQFTRAFDGNPWAGFFATLPVPVDMTVNKYVLVKVLKTRISPIKFKVEGGTTDPSNFEIPSTAAQTKIGEWEQMVFHFTNADGTYPRIVFMPDFEDPVTLTEDIMIYFDDIVFSETAVGSNIQVIEDYEGIIPINTMANGHLDVPEAFKMAANPAPDEVNSSDSVMMFIRAFDGNPWAGFWSELLTPVDLTLNKYMRVKVLKSRITPIKFKVDGGTTDPSSFEIESKDAQTKVNEWEEVVFHFEDATGTYSKISFMPDFEDPVTLTEDDTIYFDDIVLSLTASGEPSGIRDPEMQQEVLIYPNPVKTSLNLDNLKDIDKVSISNIVGQQVMVTRNVKTRQLVINVSSLTNGVYLVSVYDKSGNSTVRKIIKE